MEQFPLSTQFARCTANVAENKPLRQGKTRNVAKATEPYSYKTMGLARGKGGINLENKAISVT